jgi:hypothetical protein
MLVRPLLSPVNGELAGVLVVGVLLAAAWSSASSSRPSTAA